MGKFQQNGKGQVTVTIPADLVILRKIEKGDLFHAYINERRNIELALGD